MLLRLASAGDLASAKARRITSIITDLYRGRSVVSQMKTATGDLKAKVNFYTDLGTGTRMEKNGSSQIGDNCSTSH